MKSVNTLREGTVGQKELATNNIIIINNNSKSNNTTTAKNNTNNNYIKHLVGKETLKEKANISIDVNKNNNKKYEHHAVKKN